MDLSERLSDSKPAIVSRWIDAAIESYHAGASGFLKKNKNRFTNPVGHALSEGLGSVFDGLLQGVGSEQMRARIHDIMRIAAVQDLKPSQSMLFLLRIREIVGDALGKKAPAGHAEVLGILNERIDALVLLSFDVFMECREKIYELRANEARNMTFRLLQRAKIITEGQLE